uniref:C2H2-type domain-containing protein n=1 Tax=Glossina palpalis gambiensis TaxID=67801 RepID=A0A1B0C5E1_9MUSC
EQRQKSDTARELSEHAKAIREQGLAFIEEIAKFMSLSCELCSVEVKNFHDLDSHMHAKHKVKRYARCCNEKFSKRFLLLDNIRQHSNPDCFTWVNLITKSYFDICFYLYAIHVSGVSQIVDLREIIYLSKIKRLKIKCSPANNVPRNLYLLRQLELVGLSDHNKNASSAVDEEIAKFMSLRCELCSVEIANFYRSPRSYARRVQRQRIFANVFFTFGAHTNCSRVFPDRKSMRNHFLMKHQKDEHKTFACFQCPSKFVLCTYCSVTKIVSFVA